MAANPLKETITTRGGLVIAGLYSGNVVSGGAAALASPGAKVVGSDGMLWSGPGRLNTIIPVTNVLGTSVIIYDGADVASGGPFVLSGHKALGLIQGWAPNGVSGMSPSPVFLDAPFSSGLCVAFKSGMNACSLAFTPA